MLEIKGYEGLYSITSCGRIYSHRSKKFLKSVIDRTNYYVVTLSKNNKKKKFLSIREAARQLKLDSSFLSKQIKRNRKAYGLTWRYKEEI